MRQKGYVGPALLHVRVVKTGLYRAENHVSVESVQEQLEAVKLDVELLKQKCDSEPKTTTSLDVTTSSSPDRLEEMIKNMKEEIREEINELRHEHRALKDDLKATCTAPKAKKTADEYNQLDDSTTDKTLNDRSLKTAALLAYSDVHEELKDDTAWTQSKDMILEAATRKRLQEQDRTTGHVTDTDVLSVVSYVKSACQCYQQELQDLNISVPLEAPRWPKNPASDSCSMSRALDKVLKLVDYVTAGLRNRTWRWVCCKC